MYGAILGDMIGAPYEFDRGNKSKDFPLFNKESQFTDDTAMTIAVADALLGLDKDADDEAVCILRSSAAADAELNGSGAAAAAAVMRC